MASKVLLVTAVVLLAKTIAAQVIGGMYGPGMIGPNLATAEMAAVNGAFGPGLPPYGPPNAMPYAANPLVYDTAAPIPITGCGFGLSLAELAANGGGFAVTSTSPVAPNGVTVQSESLMFEGPLAVTGTMPFLGSVGLEGPLPAAGQGAVAYGCGNGNVGILTEELPGLPAAAAAATYPGPMGPPAMPGYNGMGPRGPCGLMY